MTPKQRDLLIRALQGDYVFLKGAGDFAAAKILKRNGWTLNEWSINRNSITQEGIDALADHSPPSEVYDDLLLISGRPVARILPGQHQKIEDMLSADQDL